ncbi:MAG: ABC transporter permease, partial [Acidimicrobiales bacterium]
MTQDFTSRPRLAVNRFRSNWLAVLGLAIVCVVVLVAVLAPVIERYPSTQLGFTPLVGPSAEHWFGTDDLGRDLWSRVINGTRLSLLVGVGSQLIAITLGATVGVVAGYRGGLLDSTLMRLTDISLAIPAVLLALLLLVIFTAYTLVMVV